MYDLRFHGGDYEEVVFWDVMPCVLVITDISDEPSFSIIRVTRIGELGTTLAVSSNRCALRRNTWLTCISSQPAAVVSYS
jgi:hypothetical protein